MCCYHSPFTRCSSHPPLAPGSPIAQATPPTHGCPFSEHLWHLHAAQPREDCCRGVLQCSHGVKLPGELPPPPQRQAGTGHKATKSPPLPLRSRFPDPGRALSAETCAELCWGRHKTPREFGLRTSPTDAATGAFSKHPGARSSVTPGRLPWLRGALHSPAPAPTPRQCLRWR